MSKEKAFTLVEVLVAALVFIICATGMMASILSIRKNAAKSDQRVMAAMFQRKIIENLRARLDANSWSTAELSDGLHGSVASPITDGEFPGMNATYTISTVGGLKKIDVTVKFPNGS